MVLLIIIMRFGKNYVLGRIYINFRGVRKGVTLTWFTLYFLLIIHENGKSART